MNIKRLVGALAWVVTLLVALLPSESCQQSGPLKMIVPLYAYPTSECQILMRLEDSVPDM